MERGDINLNKIKKCCFCGKKIEFMEQNNPSPVNNEEGAVCCSDCNSSIVIPARIKQIYGKEV